MMKLQALNVMEINKQHISICENNDIGFEKNTKNEKIKRLFYSSQTICGSKTRGRKVKSKKRQKNKEQRRRRTRNMVLQDTNTRLLDWGRRPRSKAVIESDKTDEVLHGTSQSKQTRSQSQKRWG